MLKKFSSVATVACLVFAALYALGPSLASRFTFLARRPESFTALVGSGPPTSALYIAPLVSIETLLTIKYLTPIDVNSTADIEVKVEQQIYVDEQATRGKGRDLPPPGLHQIEHLEWPISLVLNGPGFEWTENEIQVAKGASLPITLHWIPRPKAAGEYQLRLVANDINAPLMMNTRNSDTVTVTTNGTEKILRKSDNVTLPISVWTYGVPKLWFQWFTLTGTVISAVFGGGGFTKLLITYLKTRGRGRSRR